MKLAEHRALEILSEKGVRVPAFTYIDSTRLNEARRAVEEAGLKPPLVLKIVDPHVVHKSDVGGVVLNVDLEELGEKARELVERVRSRLGHRPRGVLVQEMAPPGGLEFIVGGIRDAVFGPSILVGAGGLLVELYDDVSLRIAPFDREEARRMVSEIKASRLLYGYRGMPPRDVEALLDAVMAVQRLMVEEPHVAEVDVNPLLVYEEGALAVDARIIMQGVTRDSREYGASPENSV